MTVEAQDVLASGQGAANQIIEALRQQQISVESQIDAARASAEAETRQLETQIGGLVEEVRLIDEQITLQQDSVAAAEAEVSLFRTAVERGAIDTFPFERFGAVEGRIIDIARTADVMGDGSLTYTVRVALALDHIEAFGEQQPFMSGMTLTARIVTREQTLIEWLFEPFFAMSRR